MTVKEIKKSVIEQIKYLQDSKDHEATCWVNLGYNEEGDKKFAIVLAWMDWDNVEEWKIYGKVAYVPYNSGMFEYDIDWLMPYDKETGEVWDTETEANDSDVIDWWIKNYKEMQAKGVA